MESVLKGFIELRSWSYASSQVGHSVEHSRTSRTSENAPTRALSSSSRVFFNKFIYR